MSQTPVAFRTRDADRFGVTSAQLLGPYWVSPTHGVHMEPEAARLLWPRCRAVQIALPPDAVFTHLTSGRLRGWWLPAIETPLIVSTRSDAPHLDRRGVYVRRCAVPDEHRRMIRGVRIASAPWTLVELAEHLALIDLVIAMGCALHRGECTKGRLAAAIVSGRRGARTYRRALQLCDGRSESAWETILRLVHVLSGIVDVEPQYKVRDANGIVVARADLRIGATRRLHEYDGGDHRTLSRHQDDLRREKVLARLLMERYGYTAREIHQAPNQIVRDAEDALGLIHEPSRVSGWLEEYERSSLSEAGAAALCRRLARFDRAAPPRQRA